MTQKRRHVIAERINLPAFNLIITPGAIAVRYLTTKEWLAEGISRRKIRVSPPEPLYSTNRLGTVAEGKSADPVTGYLHEGQVYFVIGETVVTKDSPELKPNWIPGVHFIFSFSEGRSRVACKSELSYRHPSSTADYIRMNPGLYLFDIWVRNRNQTFDEVPRSVTTAPGTVFISNLASDELGQEETAAYVMQGGKSKWLSLEYRLYPEQASVKPEGWVDFVFLVRDGLTHETATDISFDGYRVEALDGYAPHTCLSVVNGVGRFRMKALGLLDGDTMRVRINNQLAEGLASSGVSVID